ncbi:MAG TPA: efflux RND transporter periplasmic adaptor subunit [Acidobacteriota bacterium]|nr:efflux RND transporter periplasmic adaptor subunit [Acidobacteriota bacterium]
MLISLTLLSACTPEPPAPTAEVIRPVRYTQVQSVGSARTRSFTGLAKAGVESRLSFKVAGTLRELNVQVGDFIRQGHVIAKLDPRDYRLRVEQAEAGLAQSRAELENAQANLRRIRGLYENNNASEADLDAAFTQVRVIEATIDSIEKQLDLARLQVEYCTLEAPVSGSVREIPVEINENVNVGQPVAVVTEANLPEVEVGIPEVLIGQVRRGSRVTVGFDAVPGESFSGHVTEVGVAASSTLNTFPVTVRLDRNDSRILPGMAAEVSFRFGSESDRSRVILPSHAVAQDRQGSFVFVLERTGEEEGRALRRPVRVGDLVAEGLEILDGLQDGDLVVVSGVSKVKEGETVKLRPEDQV